MPIPQTCKLGKLGLQARSKACTGKATTIDIGNVKLVTHQLKDRECSRYKVNSQR